MELGREGAKVARSDVVCQSGPEVLPGRPLPLVGPSGPRHLLIVASEICLPSLTVEVGSLRGDRSRGLQQSEALVIGPAAGAQAQTLPLGQRHPSAQSSRASMKAVAPPAVASARVPPESAVGANGSTPSGMGCFSPRPASCAATTAVSTAIAGMCSPKSTALWTTTVVKPSKAPQHQTARRAAPVAAQRPPTETVDEQDRSNAEQEPDGAPFDQRLKIVVMGVFHHPPLVSRALSVDQLDMLEGAVSGPE